MSTFNQTLNGICTIIGAFLLIYEMKSFNVLLQKVVILELKRPELQIKDFIVLKS